MYLKHYGLNQQPFNLCPDPGFLYPSKVHKTALDHLEYGLSEGMGFILLTGDVGMGKTTLVRHVLSRLSPDMEVAMVFNTNVAPDELLRLILQEFELPTSTDKAKNHDRLHDFLINLYARGRRALIVVDEAQNLSRAALEELRMLSNLQTESEALLQTVLVGQPELAGNMAHPGLRQLAQRVAVSYSLEALTPEETKGYMEYRLSVSGGDREIFTPEAVDMIHEAAQGVPRLINRLCDAALLAGYADGADVVGPDLVAETVRERERLGALSGKVPPVRDQGDAPRGDDRGPEDGDSVQIGLKAMARALEQTGDRERRLAQAEMRLDMQAREISRLKKTVRELRQAPQRPAEQGPGPLARLRLRLERWLSGRGPDQRRGR